MAKRSCSDDEFIQLIETEGFAGTARRLQCDIRSLYRRRDRIEKRLNRTISAPNNFAIRVPMQDYPHRLFFTVENGIVLIGSDPHYWPEDNSTAHRGFVHLCRKLKPSLVIKNGDVLDGARISRHAPIGWEKRPELIDELTWTKAKLSEISHAVDQDVPKVWPLGNHDGRFETRLATVAPEYAKIQGVHLQDHFPDWEPCWSVWINDNVVIKHRFRGGIHATHNNTLWSGKTIITGHLHSLKVTPFTDYNGTRWGVDAGTLADPEGPQFRDYTEDSPKNWRSGFIVLTFHNRQLLWPEIVYTVAKNQVSFRGEIITV